MNHLILMRVNLILAKIIINFKSHRPNTILSRLLMKIDELLDNEILKLRILNKTF